MQDPWGKLNIIMLAISRAIIQSIKKEIYMVPNMKGKLYRLNKDVTVNECDILTSTAKVKKYLLNSLGLHRST